MLRLRKSRLFLPKMLNGPGGTQDSPGNGRLHFGAKVSCFGKKCLAHHSLNRGKCLKYACIIVPWVIQIDSSISRWQFSFRRENAFPFPLIDLCLGKKRTWQAIFHPIKSREGKDGMFVFSVEKRRRFVYQIRSDHPSIFCSNDGKKLFPTRDTKFIYEQTVIGIKELDIII